MAGGFYRSFCTEFGSVTCAFDGRLWVSERPSIKVSPLLCVCLHGRVILSKQPNRAVARRTVVLDALPLAALDPSHHFQSVAGGVYGSVSLEFGSVRSAFDARHWVSERPLVQGFALVVRLF